ncbi:hypothetical protein K440DRAFT_620711 [Wilcoxina mikolae CBS 423.85]|nr:hypothetical protein K440DRAFT_620711 [Wilcoxina mikolae CBS 423.85]
MNSKPSEQDDQNETRKREPRCWSCINDRKGCNIEKNAPDLTPCLRCRKLKHICSEEAPKDWKTRPQSRLKCTQCRQQHIKCIFPDGESPVQCDHCKSRNLECSQPQEPPTAASKKRAQQDLDSGPHVPTTPNKKTATPTKKKLLEETAAVELSTVHVAPVKSAEQHTGVLTASATDPDEAAAKLLLGLGVTGTDLGFPSPEASVSEKIPLLPVVDQSTDDNFSAETFGSDTTSRLKRLKLGQQPADSVDSINYQVHSAPNVENTPVNQTVLRMFAQFRERHPNLSEKECLERLESTLARVDTEESSLPTSPILGSSTTTTSTSERSESPCLSSGCLSSGPPAAEFRNETTPRPPYVSSEPISYPHGAAGDQL